MSDVLHTVWEGDDSPTEERIRLLMQSEGLEPFRWTNASGDRYPVKKYEYQRVIYCVEGSVWVMLTDERDRAIELEPGDRIAIPAGLRHSIVAGIDGVTCLEGHRSGA